MIVLGILVPWVIVGLISASTLAELMNDGTCGESLSATTKKVIVVVVLLGGLATAALAILVFAVEIVGSGFAHIVRLFKSK